MERVDGNGLDCFADRLDPLFRNAGASDDAENRTAGRAGTVGIVAAVDRETDRTAEVALAVEKTDNRIGDVCRSLEAAEIRTVVEHFLTGGLPVLSGVEGVEYDFNAAGDAAVGGDAGKRIADELAQIALDERRGFKRRGENFRIDAVIRMVDTGVIPRIRSAFVGFSGEETCPDFRADPCAVAVFPDVVVAEAGKRRKQTVHHIELADAVFVPRSGDVGEPVVAEHALVDLIDTVFLNRLEPDKLKVEVVVRRGFSLEVLRIERDVERTLFPFKRRAERPADVLAGPAAEHLVAVNFAVQKTCSGVR